ncbi:hypothetical protein RB195_004385 [Necator americanus]|uniref:Uncharacterized protein n=1 Tax=Necator americanus TaxID=51031 RepID=A0ABR1BHQ0_NECAM
MYDSVQILKSDSGGVRSSGHEDHADHDPTVVLSNWIYDSKGTVASGFFAIEPIVGQTVGLLAVHRRSRHPTATDHIHAKLVELTIFPPWRKVKQRYFLQYYYI